MEYGSGSVMMQLGYIRRYVMDTGSTAWIMTASALVLLMTPGLAFFYGGLVRAKNVVSTIMYLSLIHI